MSFYLSTQLFIDKARTLYTKCNQEGFLNYLGVFKTTDSKANENFLKILDKIPRVLITTPKDEKLLFAALYQMLNTNEDRARRLFSNLSDEKKERLQAFMKAEIKNERKEIKKQREELEEQWEELEALNAEQEADLKTASSSITHGFRNHQAAPRGAQGGVTERPTTTPHSTTSPKNKARCNIQ